MQYKQSPSTTHTTTTTTNSLWATYEDNNCNINSMDIKHVKSEKPVEKPKRKQVKNACVNCQKACKKCDDGRPCKRCVKLGLTATCRDSDRKERKKGVKRGPYKKRQAYNKDKPVYPKLLTESQQWKTPIYENVPQVLSHATTNQFLEEEAYCVPSQHIQLSPTSSCSFDESDETLHYAYGYGYTNTSMLDHNQTISGNGTPTVQEDFFNSWDDYSSGSSHASPIGCNPITTNNIIPYKQESQMMGDLLPLDLDNSYWLLNQPDIPPVYQPLPDHQFFDYRIPSQPLYNNINIVPNNSNSNNNNNIINNDMSNHHWTFAM